MLRESAYGLGCTRWEVTRDVVVRYGIRGILGGIFIGMGRALGETMAVLFVIGNMMVSCAPHRSPHFDKSPSFRGFLLNKCTSTSGKQEQGTMPRHPKESFPPAQLHS
ncbi:MAG: ABC transporter permease subunit, partial [Akkermansia sp.]|nr:ABC transporter permease subunit [Akkermansia sp.]